MISPRSLMRMAEFIKHDFDKVVIKQYPDYQNSWRYKELVEMMQELETGQMKDHRVFGHFMGMGYDELYDYACLMQMIDKFSAEFDLYRR
jgi:hypothetical protein